MNQTALITGASSGIGKEFATQLAAKGMDVILVARSTGKLQELATELQTQWNVNATVITADLSKEYGAKDVYKQTQELGLTVDYLVNNAGFATSGEFLSNPHETDHNQVMVNVAAVVDMTHLYLKDMVAKGSGTIINLASVVSFQPVPYMAVYGATKAFVLSFTESLWEEYRKKGIKVLALCPGATATSFFETAGDVVLREDEDSRTSRPIRLPSPGERKQLRRRWEVELCDHTDGAILAAESVDAFCGGDYEEVMKRSLARCVS